MGKELFNVTLAEEFRAKPIGVHSATLQRVLNIMRGAPVTDKYVLVCTEPYEEWILAQLPGQPGAPVRLFPDQRFTSIEVAEWYVFKLRWKSLTAETLKD
jgi:hypothetical protein